MNKKYKIQIVLLCVFAILLSSFNSSGQDVVRIDSSGIRINDFFLGKPIDDLFNKAFSVEKFKKIILKPYKKNRKTSSNIAFTKNNNTTKFSTDRYPIDSFSSIVQIEQEYTGGKFIVFYIGDLEVNIRTTYGDIISSEFYKSLVDIPGSLISKKYSLFFKNVYNLNVDILINVENNKHDKIYNIVVILNDIVNYELDRIKNLGNVSDR